MAFIAETIPARVVRYSNTTLFKIAEIECGDALQWVAIARLNGLIDPWITAQMDILIPPVLPTGTLTGILDSFVGELKQATAATAFIAGHPLPFLLDSSMLDGPETLG